MSNVWPATLTLFSSARRTTAARWSLQGGVTLAARSDTWRETAKVAADVRFQTECVFVDVAKFARGNFGIAGFLTTTVLVSAVRTLFLAYQPTSRFWCTPVEACGSYRLTRFCAPSPTSRVLWAIWFQIHLPVVVHATSRPLACRARRAAVGGSCYGCVG
jgi:hypothetical protein